jgi:ADP-heptose:LPS heptosyltransferase
VFDLLGPAEESERPLPDTIPVRDWPLPDVLALLGRADAYVGHDSGPSHLAGAAGCRGVVLFGPTEPAAWRPASARLIAVCGANADRSERLTSLRAERVYVALVARPNS